MTSAWVEKTTLEMADGIIAVSQSTAADVARLFDRDPATITVIPNGIDTETYARTLTLPASPPMASMRRALTCSSWAA